MRNRLLKELPMIQENRSRKNTCRHIQFVPHSPAQPKWLSDLVTNFSQERYHNSPTLRRTGKLFLMPASNLFCCSQLSSHSTSHLYIATPISETIFWQILLSVTGNLCHKPWQAKVDWGAGTIQWLPLASGLLDNKEVFSAFIKHGSWALKLKW